jgi:hypothetical protein
MYDWIFPKEKNIKEYVFLFLFLFFFKLQERSANLQQNI